MGIFKNAISGLIGTTILAGSVIAQTVPTTEEPGRVGERFSQSTTPAFQATTNPVSIQAEGCKFPPAALDQITMRLSGVRVVTSSIYDQSVFDAAFADLRGKQVTLRQVCQAVDSLNERYKDDDYLANIFLPAQELDPDNAQIQLAARELHFAQTSRPAALNEYRDIFTGFEAALQADKPARGSTYDRATSVVKTLPGITVRPGWKRIEGASEPGAVELTWLFDEAANNPSAYSFTLDNRGTEGSGPYQFTVGAEYRNVLKLHETISVSYSGTTDWGELHYLSLGYSQLLNPRGTTMAFSGTYSTGEPGTDTLRTLQYESKGWSFGANISHPLILDRQQRLDLTFGLDWKNASSEMLGSTNSDDRLRIASLGLNYVTENPTVSGQRTTASVTLSQGIDGLGSTENGNPRASRSDGQVDFTKLAFALGHQRPLPTVSDRLSLSLQMAGQYAFDPLLSSQECGYGGASYGRGFDSSEILADHCLKASAEVSYAAKPFSESIKSVSYYGFADWGKVWQVDAPAGTVDSARGTSWGLGTRMRFDGGLSANLELAKPASGRIDDDWRVFMKVGVSW